MIEDCTIAFIGGFCLSFVVAWIVHLVRTVLAFFGDASGIDLKE